MSEFNFKKYLKEGRLLRESDSERIYHEVISKIKSLVKSGKLEQSEVEDYVDEMDGFFEPDAYYEISDEDLIKDIELYNSGGMGIYNDEEDLWNDGDIDPAGGYGPSSHLEEDKLHEEYGETFEEYKKALELYNTKGQSKYFSGNMDNLLNDGHYPSDVISRMIFRSGRPATQGNWEKDMADFGDDGFAQLMGELNGILGDNVNESSTNPEVGEDDYIFRPYSDSNFETMVREYTIMAYDYFDKKLPHLSPDEDDIAGFIMNQFVDNEGITVSDEEENIIYQIIAGDDLNEGDDYQEVDDYEDGGEEPGEYDDPELNENSTNYSFEDLKDLVKSSDLNNPDKNDWGIANDVLMELGFYNEDGEIRSENFTDYITTDGKTLHDLDHWFEYESGMI